MEENYLDINEPIPIGIERIAHKQTDQIFKGLLDTRADLDGGCAQCSY